MKNYFLPIFALLALLFCCPEVISQARSVAPLASAPLEVQISAPKPRNSERLIALDPNQPHLNVILRNASGKSLQIYQEWNSWGFYNLHLEITELDGQKLLEPLLIAKGPRAWTENAASTDILSSQEAVVREVHLHVPFESENPVTRELNPWGNSYGFFPFPSQSMSRRKVTIKAVFEVKSVKPQHPEIWTGRIESSPLTCEIVWGAPRR